ncbi:unnamed protein product [Pedinophyceae sp. YPF-701]|nr:unnamed protein product [Pedinophyceae sp. YPF-701]
MSASLTFRANVAATRPLTAQGPARAATARTALKVEARVVIRFMRFGRRYQPFYRLCAVDSRKPRDTRPLQFLGHYDPFTKETNLNAPAIKEWLNKGAKPSESAEALLKKAMVIIE